MRPHLPGGVDLRQVNPRTMESQLCPGLYLAGELLDLQEDTGGYNLQAAFSTGWLAGDLQRKVLCKGVEKNTNVTHHRVCNELS